MFFIFSYIRKIHYDSILDILIKLWPKFYGRIGRGCRYYHRLIYWRTWYLTNIKNFSYQQSIHRGYCKTCTRAHSNRKIKFMMILVHPTFICNIHLYVTIESEDILHKVTIPPKCFLLVQNNQFNCTIRISYCSDSHGNIFILKRGFINIFIFPQREKCIRVPMYTKHQNLHIAMYLIKNKSFMDIIKRFMPL